MCPREHGPWNQDAWRNWLRRVYRPAAINAGLARNWLRRVYRPAAINAGLAKTTRARDLRGSFASLLIWEGQTVVVLAQQLGHSPEMCLRAYAGVFAEFSIDERIPAEKVIQNARAKLKTQ